jgi:hypothetical protein
VGKALPIASRTMRRCTFHFLATPEITPHSYSLRICSKSYLCSPIQRVPRLGCGPNQEYPFVWGGPD